MAITDSGISPIALLADGTIIIGVESPSFLPSTVADIATVKNLVELLVSRAGPSTVKRIVLAENQLVSLGAYSRT